MVSRNKLAKKLSQKKKGLFDHVKHIRQNQTQDYYDKLTESEQKTFNNYMVLRVLSMDPKIIEEISYISKYMEVLPENKMYELLIKCLPKDYGFHKYIKKSSKDVNETIVDCICKKYQIGSKDAVDYYNMMILTDRGLSELVELVSSYGYTEKELEKIFE